jgi:hypothetical protein
MKGKELVVDLVVIVPFVIHHFRGKYILQRQPSVSKTLSDSIAVFFFCLDCTLLMYVLVHSVYTLYVWLKIDASRYKIDILDLPTTLRFSRFRRPCPSLVTFHEPSSTVWMTSKYCHQKICNSCRPSIYTQKVIFARSLIFDYIILCFRPCLSHVVSLPNITILTFSFFKFKVIFFTVLTNSTIFPAWILFNP